MLEMKGDKMKITHCPYENSLINMENLAYEIRQAKYVMEDELFNSESFKELTSSNKGKSVVNYHDIERVLQFGYNPEDPIHLNLFGGEKVRIVYQSKNFNGRSKIHTILRKIDSSNSVGNNNELAVYNYNDKSLYQTTSADENSILNDVNRAEAWDDEEDDIPDEKDMYKITKYVLKPNGEYEFYHKARLLMTAVPCCPNCHMRLPVGWGYADDFGAVALMGPTASGKTSLLLSMMNKNWKVFQGITLNGKPIHITSALQPGYGDTYDDMLELSKKMCRKVGGKCPKGDKPEFWKLPVFLRVEYNGKVLILGIYDFPGENLANPDMINNQALEAVKKNTYAEIYLFDPRNDFVGIDLPPAQEAKDKKLFNRIFSSCNISEITEQGKLQKENAGKAVPANKVWDDAITKHRQKGQDLSETDSGDENPTGTTLDVYKNIIAARAREGTLRRMKDMCFSGVIIKCDLLENLFEDEDKYMSLFERRKITEINYDEIEGKSTLVEKMIKDHRLFGEVDVADIGIEFEKSRTWHCVSALGCDAYNHDELMGAYNPINVAGPLLECIFRRISDNGWIG